MMILPFIGPAYETGVVGFESQKCINWYIELNYSGQTFNDSMNKPFMLRPTPGMKAFCTLGTDKSVRGVIAYRGVLYAVGDNNLYSVDSSGTETLIGTLNTDEIIDNSVCKLVAGNDNIVIRDRGQLFVYNVSGNTLNRITDADLPINVADISYVDGYWVAIEQDTQSFYLSQAADPTSWEALDFALAGSGGDYLKAVTVDHGELWLFGDNTTEIWRNVGDVDFAFERIPGVTLEYGIAAKDTVVRSSNSIYWLAKDKSGQNIVVRAEGYAPRSVTNPAIAHQINTYGDVSDAIAYNHRVGSHEFYVITFPSADKTWVLDISNDQWHERQSYDGVSFGRHKGVCATLEYNKSLVGDYSSNNIYEYDIDTYDEGGDVLRRVRRSPVLFTGNTRISLFNVVFNFEPGVGLASGHGSNPQMMLRVSGDGGHTWNNELMRGLGVQGDYDARAVFSSLGQGYNWVLEAVVTDPINATLLSVTAEVQ